MVLAFAGAEVGGESGAETRCSWSSFDIDMASASFALDSLLSTTADDPVKEALLLVDLF